MIHNAEDLRRKWMQEAGFSEADIVTSLRDNPPFSIEREAMQLQIVRKENARRQAVEEAVEEE